MVCTGAKSVEYSRHAARKFARIIQKLGYEDAKFLEFKVQNMVGSVDVKFPIRLEGLVLSHSAFSNYEPELFPGLIYRMVRAWDEGDRTFPKTLALYLKFWINFLSKILGKFLT